MHGISNWLIIYAYIVEERILGANNQAKNRMLSHSPNDRFYHKANLDLRINIPTRAFDSAVLVNYIMYSSISARLSEFIINNSLVHA